MFAQKNATPEILLNELAELTKTNQYEKIKPYVLPVDDESAKEIDQFIELLRLQQEIRNFFIKGNNKFKGGFDAALDMNVLMILRMLSPNYYEQAAKKNKISINNNLARIEFEYPALAQDNLTYKDAITFKKKDNQWYIAFSKDMYNAPLDKVLIALKKYLPKAIQAVEESPDSGTLAEKLENLNSIFKK